MLNKHYVIQNAPFNDVTRAPAIDSWMGQNFSSCTRFTPTRCLWAGQTPVIVVPVVHP